MKTCPICSLYLSFDDVDGNFLWCEDCGIVVFKSSIDACKLSTLKMRAHMHAKSHLRCVTVYLSTRMVEECS